MLKTLFLLVFVFGIIQLNAQTLKIPSALMQLEIPGKEWHLHDSAKHINNKIYYVYKRESIVDSLGRRIIPNIAIIIEDSVPDSTDLVEYSAPIIGTERFKIIKFYDSNLVKFGYGFVVKGKYTDKDEAGNSYDHIIYSVFLINNNKGVQVICDITSSLFQQYDSEFEKMIKSIKGTPETSTKRMGFHSLR